MNKMSSTKISKRQKSTKKIKLKSKIKVLNGWNFFFIIDVVPVFFYIRPILKFLLWEFFYEKMILRKHFFPNIFFPEYILCLMSFSEFVQPLSLHRDTLIHVHTTLHVQSKITSKTTKKC